MKPSATVVFLPLAMVVGLACDRATSNPPQVVPPPAAAPANPAEEFQKNSASIIEQYLRDHPIRKVQLGAGASRLKGWLNTDIEPGGNGLAYLDATKRFPFEDGEIHYIFSEHVIEHLTYDEGKAMIAEAFRVLAPGGRMRISTPDLTRFIDLFSKNPGTEAKAYLVGKIAWHEWPKEPNPAAIILNLQMSSWGHKFMYDAETLDGALTRAGFRDVREYEENLSDNEHLLGLEERDTGVNVRWSDYETMSIEAGKPTAATITR